MKKCLLLFLSVMGTMILQAQPQPTLKCCSNFAGVGCSPASRKIVRVGYNSWSVAFAQQYPGAAFCAGNVLTGQLQQFFQATCTEKIGAPAGANHGTIDICGIPYVF